MYGCLQWRCCCHAAARSFEVNTSTRLLTHAMLILRQVREIANRLARVSTPRFGGGSFKDAN